MLQGAMTLPLTLPDWLPWWVATVLLVPGLLYLLLLLAMPFSVLGLKSRLESIDARLDDLQTELRTLTARPTEESERAAPPPTIRLDRPIAADEPPRTMAAREARDGTRQRQARPVRSEPRLDWPR